MHFLLKANGLLLGPNLKGLAGESVLDHSGNSDDTTNWSETEQGDHEIADLEVSSDNVDWSESLFQSFENSPLRMN